MVEGDKVHGITDAEFREITCRALDRIGLPSLGHVMVRLRHYQGLLAECREWMKHVEGLGYDRVDPTLRASLDDALSGYDDADQERDLRPTETS